eukprot:gene1758-33170_t
MQGTSQVPRGHSSALASGLLSNLPPTGSNSLSVLLVDPDTACTAKLMLEECNHKVFVARSSRDALSFLSSPDGASIDVVLKDHEPPRSDGGRMLRRMAQNGINTPVIVMSSKNDPMEAVKCVNAGALDFLVKPLRHNELRMMWARVWFWQKCALNLKKAPEDRRADACDSATVTESPSCSDGGPSNEGPSNEAAWGVPRDSSSQDNDGCTRVSAGQGRENKDRSTEEGGGTAIRCVTNGNGTSGNGTSGDDDDERSGERTKASSRPAAPAEKGLLHGKSRCSPYKPALFNTNSTPVHSANPSYSLLTTSATSHYCLCNSAISHYRICNSATSHYRHRPAAPAEKGLLHGKSRCSSAENTSESAATILAGFSTLGSSPGSSSVHPYAGHAFRPYNRNNSSLKRPISRLAVDYVGKRNSTEQAEGDGEQVEGQLARSQPTSGAIPIMISTPGRRMSVEELPRVASTQPRELPQPPRPSAQSEDLGPSQTHKISIPIAKVAKANKEEGFVHSQGGKLQAENSISTGSQKPGAGPANDDTAAAYDWSQASNEVTMQNIMATLQAQTMVRQQLDLQSQKEARVQAQAQAHAHVMPSQQKQAPPQQQPHSESTHLGHSAMLYPWSKERSAMSTEAKRQLRVEALTLKYSHLTLKYSHLVRYENRKRYADTRPRVNGRFVCGKGGGSNGGTRVEYDAVDRSEDMEE